MVTGLMKQDTDIAFVVKLDGVDIFDNLPPRGSPLEGGKVTDDGGAQKNMDVWRESQSERICQMADWIKAGPRGPPIEGYEQYNA